MSNNVIITPQFEAFNKIPRLSRDVVVTEKLDGTNAQVLVTEDGEVFAGSRSRWITPGKNTDNHGFAGWVEANKQDLLQLGPGRHFGEWWGAGIQRGYGLKEKHFSLFNVAKWGEVRPACCHVVPVLYSGEFDTARINSVVTLLKACGSSAAPGFMDPEGIIIFHTASGYLFKKTVEKDEQRKGQQETRCA